MNPAIDHNAKNLTQEPKIYLNKIRSLQDEEAEDEDCELVVVDGEEQCLRPV
jgi:hypothetical protein